MLKLCNKGGESAEFEIFTNEKSTEKLLKFCRRSVENKLQGVESAVFEDFTNAKIMQERF